MRKNHKRLRNPRDVHQDNKQQRSKRRKRREGEELHEVEQALSDFRKAERRLGRGSAGGRGRGIPFARRAIVAAVVVLLLCVLVPPYRYPVEGDVTSGFLPRLKPDRGFWLAFEMHHGLDIGAPRGSPVSASRSGIVTEAGTHPAYGNYIEMRHLFGFTSLYAHMSELNRDSGDLVLRGGTIGKVGTTGRTTGPHLHLEIRAGDTRLPPRLMLLFHSIRRWILGF